MKSSKSSSADQDRAAVSGCSVLRTSLLGRGLADGEFTSLCDVLIAEDFAPGTDILTEGLTYQALWVVVSGHCEVVKKAEDRERRLAEFGTGDVFGEMSFFQKQTHSASVRAMQPTKTLRLMSDCYAELRKSHPETVEKIATNMIQLLTERLRRMDEWTCQMVTSTGSQQQQTEWMKFRSKLSAF